MPEKTNVTDRAAQPASTDFVLSRTFNAPRAQVFKFWTECEHLRHWFGPKGVTMRECKMDFRPGGSLHYCQVAPDGRQMWGKWIFREIAAPERVVAIVSFSDEKGSLARNPMSANWPLQALSIFSFAEQDGKTTVTIRWSPYEATEVERKTFESAFEGMRQGWASTLDRLDVHIAETKGSRA
jgi:uncharacterized protein YndB with AHSA1/START domain